MRRREPDYYRKFRCIGGACPDTCCKDWEIVLDEQTLEAYQQAPQGLRERLKAGIVDNEDGERCFRLGEDGRCAMLTQDGWCAVQREWGEEHLCGHCAAYPRFVEEYGCLTESALAISCPEAARLLLEAPGFALVEEEDGGADLPFEGVDGGMLSGLEHTRAMALEALTRGEGTVWKRLAQVLALAYDGQDALDFCAYDQLFQCAPLEPQGAEMGGREMALRVLERWMALEPLRPEWPALLQSRCAQLSGLDEGAYDALRAGFQEAYPQWEGQLTRVAGYLIFRHWLKAVNDDGLYGRAVLVGGACVALYHLMALEWQAQGILSVEGAAALCSAFGREVEHMEDNFMALVEDGYHLECWPLYQCLMGL